MKNLAIIPARSGSKGLPDKNVKILNGKPLMAYSIEAALKSLMFDRIMVSTDSNVYAGIARQFGAEVPFMRSKKTSGDNSSSRDMVQEVLEMYNEIGERFDTVCLLQPTSPLRTEEDIQLAYALMKEKGASAITSVCQVDHSPLWCTTLDENLSLYNFRKGLVNAVNRQALPTYYRLNGAVYIRKIKYIGTTINVLCENELAYIMPKNRSIDIDDEFDFRLSEILIK